MDGWFEQGVYSYRWDLSIEVLLASLNYRYKLHNLYLLVLYMCALSSYKATEKLCRNFHLSSQHIPSTPAMEYIKRPSTKQVY